MASLNKGNPLSTNSDSSDDDDVNQYVIRPSSPKPPVVEVSNEEIGEEDLSTDEEQEYSSSEEHEEVQHSQHSSKNPKHVASAQSESDSDSEPKTSGIKRVVDDNNANRNSSKRSKKKEAVAATASGSGEGNDHMQEDVRLPGGRVFSVEDDVVVQKGIVDFMSKTGNDPLKNSKAFHNFMNDSIRAEIKTKQLKRKVRAFKEKFEGGKWKCDEKAFRILKKIGWRNKGGNEIVKEKGKGKVGDDMGLCKVSLISSKRSKKKKEAVTTLKNIASSSNNVESDVDKLLNEMFCFGDDMGLCTMCMTEEDARKGLELMGDSKRAKLIGKWRQHHIEAMKVLVDRAEFVNYMATLILKELQKSTD